MSTVRHALRVVELVAARDGMTPKQLAAALDLKLGTVYHLVNTLLDEGYLVRTTGGALHLGDRLPQLLECLDERLDPYPELNEELARLALATRTTAVIGQLIGRQVMITAVQSFPGAVHQRLLRSGLRGHAHSMAIGKVLIARLPRRQVSELIDDWSLDQLTERTISRRDVLVEAIETAARRGFGLDLEEGVPGLTCIAAPIWTPVGRPPAAMALGLTPDQFRSEGERLVGLVVDSVRRSSHILRAVSTTAAVPPGRPPHSAPPALPEGSTSGHAPWRASPDTAPGY
ncbi:MAG: helix-turn-helix domain-containing protein [Chloroflexi bacterium]|nr:helix-turn-helix domain-containing protein [Chloroflexota bacterium]